MANITSKIIGFFRADGTALVRYSAGSVSRDLRVPVPIVEGSYIQGVELQTHIDGMAPTYAFERNEQVAAADASMFPPEPVAAPVIDPFESMTIDEALDYARVNIDRAATDARLRFISGGYGQETTYQIKASQAQAYKDAGYKGTVPAYIDAEAAATGKTPKALSDTILSNQTAWNAINVQIEAARVGGKSALDGLPDKGAVEDAMRAAVAVLQAIKP